MRRSLALPIGIAVGFLIFVLLLTQLLLPPLAARQIEHKLTKNGGTAHVSLHAFPALRLLFKHGDSIDVIGNGLSVQLGAGTRQVLKKLDGFGAAHIDLMNVTAGPFEAKRFTLDKEKGSSTYKLGVSASFSPSDLAGYLGSRVGGGLGGLLGGLAGGFVPGASTPVPVAVHAQLASDNGNPRVVSGGGAVAGVQLGPVLEAVAAAVIAQL
jgi:hypothetical protein